jgi:hypothetical protein
LLNPSGRSHAPSAFLLFHVDISSYLLIVAALAAFWGRFESFVATTFGIRSHGDLYNDAMGWDSTHVDPTGSWKAVAGTKMELFLGKENKSNEDELLEADRAYFDIDPLNPWVKRHQNN